MPQGTLMKNALPVNVWGCNARLASETQSRETWDNDQDLHFRRMGLNSKELKRCPESVEHCCEPHEVQIVILEKGHLKYRFKNTSAGDGRGSDLSMFTFHAAIRTSGVLYVICKYFCSGWLNQCSRPLGPHSDTQKECCEKRHAVRDVIQRCTSPYRWSVQDYTVEVLLNVYHHSGVQFWHTVHVNKHSL